MYCVGWACVRSSRSVMERRDGVVENYRPAGRQLSQCYPSSSPTPRECCLRMRGHEQSEPARALILSIESLLESTHTILWERSTLSCVGKSSLIMRQEWIAPIQPRQRPRSCEAARGTIPMGLFGRIVKLMELLRAGTLLNCDV